jgi:HSP20 family protein
MEGAFHPQAELANRAGLARLKMNREYISASYHLMERAYGSFERVIPLPRYVDPEGAEASYESGVLTVTLPKLESAAPRRLTVR